MPPLRAPLVAARTGRGGAGLGGTLVVGAPLGSLGWHLLTATRGHPAGRGGSASKPHPRAGQGEVAAQLELGRRHEDGDGTRVNTSEASRWYARAADAGDREGQYRYGLALLEGRGVVQDYRSALEWLTRAAEQNHPKAQRRLGQMYADGRGTPVDKVQAYVWLSLAAAGGEDDAARLRDQVLMHLPYGAHRHGAGNGSRPACAPDRRCTRQARHGCGPVTRADPHDDQRRFKTAVEVRDRLTPRTGGPSNLRKRPWKRGVNPSRISERPPSE